MPIKIPASLSGRPRSLLIHSGISMMYMVLQVHIRVEAINSLRTFLSFQPLTWVTGIAPAESTRETEGSAKAISPRLMAKMAAAMENMAVKP
ncbi:hypothetical protein D3C76_1496810 [compost metagenome]